MSSRPPGENPPFEESDTMFTFTEGRYPQDANAVSYLVPASEWLARYIQPQEFGQLHGESNATPHLEFLFPSDASQFSPPEPAQPADLAAGVQVSEAVGSVNSPDGVLPRCEHCDKTFGRPQELKRHSNQVHTPGRRCPFKPCPYTWKRPDKIRAHITKVHGSKLCPSVIRGVRRLRGRDVLDFVDAYDLDIPDEYVSFSVPLEPSGESGPYLSDYCGCQLIDVSSVGVVEQTVEEVAA